MNCALQIIKTAGCVCVLAAFAHGQQQWVVVYHPWYQWSAVPATSVPWTKITHLCLGALWPLKSGATWTLGVSTDDGRSWAAWSAAAKHYIDDGHGAGRKVTCMLGGAGSNPNKIWNTATAAANIDSFAMNIRNKLQPLGFDGTDLDWEDDVTMPQLVSLAKKIRAAWPGAVITIPTGFNGGDAASFAPAKDAVDAFMPMSYLDIAQWGGWRIPVPLTPLYAFGDNPYSVDGALASWVKAGVPASKIVMGVGGFGAAWGDGNNDGRGPVAPYSNADLNAGAQGETQSLANDNVVTQTWVRQALAANSKLTEAWDSVGKCSYWHTSAATDFASVPIWGNPAKVSLVFYETVRSMAEKAAFIKQKGMKGLMFWTLSEMIDGSSCPILDSLNLTGTTSCTGKIPASQRKGILPEATSSDRRFTIASRGPVSLSLYDLRGKKIATFAGYVYEHGLNTVMLPGPCLAKGVYMCRTRSGTFSAEQVQEALTK